MQALADLAPGTFPQWGTFLTALATLTGLITVYIKGMPERMRAGTEAKVAEAEGDSKLRAELLERIARQDAKIDAQDLLITKEREDCHRQIARLEGMIQIFRHARNNADARFQALLMLLKRNPDDVPGTITLIENMVRRQEQALAAEKGAMASANLWSTNPVEAAAEQAVQATQETLAEVKADIAEGKKS